MIFIPFMRGATSWEGQIGQLWWSVRRPRFWLYGRTPGYGRTWLFNWPGFIRIAPKD